MKEGSKERSSSSSKLVFYIQSTGCGYIRGIHISYYIFNFNNVYIWKWVYIPY